MEERKNLTTMTGFRWGYWNYPYNYGDLFLYPLNAYLSGRCQDYGGLDVELLEDRDITQYVFEHLYAQPGIPQNDKTRIEVNTVDNLVTLSGSVHYPQSKVLAYLEAFRTAGVKDVNSKIILERGKV